MDRHWVDRHWQGRTGGIRWSRLDRLRRLDRLDNGGLLDARSIGGQPGEELLKQLRLPIADHNIRPPAVGEQVVEHLSRHGNPERPRAGVGVQAAAVTASSQCAGAPERADMTTALRNINLSS